MALFSKTGKNPDDMSFLDHLESLRWHITRSVIAVVVTAGASFFFSDFIFGTVLFGPRRADFITYKWLCDLSNYLGMGKELCMDPIKLPLISTEMSGQFTMHMWVSVVAGIIIASPYILWELWRFIKPALRPSERKYATSFIFFASFLFIGGVVLSYYLICPFAINFLSNYQITSDPSTVVNFTSLDSYISVITTLTLLTGLVFELPIVVYFLTRFGIMTPEFMRRHRRHAIVIIMIIAAIITPTSDILTLLLVFVPIYTLYEISIFVSAYVMHKNAKHI
jgi:sec-independent protein translocase protein TatC